MLRWYLIRTKPRAEAVAHANLCRQGYVTYSPRVLQPVPARGRWRDRIVPLFPGYLFLQLDEGRQPLGPVRSTVGVTGVVRFGACYAIVPDDVVIDLRERADPESGVHRLSPPQHLVPGDSVRIAWGPFEGLEGIFQRQTGTERAIVLLAVLGRTTGVRIPVTSVVPRRAA